MFESVKSEDIFANGKKFSQNCKVKTLKGAKSVAVQLDGDLKEVRKTYRKAILGDLKGNGASREWLCDNYYLIEREGRDALKGMRSLEELPCDAQGYPIVYKIAESVSKEYPVVSAKECKLFLSGVKEGYEFSNAELYAFRVMLVAASVANIARECKSMQSGKMSEERKLSAGITTLRGIESIDFEETFAALSESEKILEKDPSGSYVNMSEETKAYYRHCLSLGAKKKGVSEKEFAQIALEKAIKGRSEREKHIGTHILPEENNRGEFYVACIWFLPAIFSVVFGFLCKSALIASIMYFPLAVVLKMLLEKGVTRFLKEKFICSMDQEKLGDESQTVVVISCLITSAEQIKKLMKNLVHIHLSGRNIKCGLLADLKESNGPSRPEDVHLLSVLEKEVRRVNNDNGGGFFVAVRKRSFVPSEGKYMGQERKRGAITDFIRYIKSQDSAAFALLAGETKGIQGSKYLLTLDADTEISINAVNEMSAVLSHPLNKIEIIDNRVTNGYGIAVPRLTTDIESSGRSFFSRIFAGSGGLHSYGGVGGDFYQNLFGEGLFTGKGLIDVDAYYMLVDGTLPLNRVLSHDILENGILKSCVLRDTEFSDSFPTTLKAWLTRLGRWIRGDFQNAVFLQGNTKNEEGELIKNNLTLCDKYKIFDNISRAVTPMFVFIGLLICALTNFNYRALIIGLLLFSVSPAEIWGAIKGVLRPRIAFRRYISNVVSGFFSGCARTFFNIMLIPQLAFLGLNEGIKVIWRSLVSHKNMLEWMTAAEAESGKKNGVIDYCRLMWFNIVSGIAFLIFGNLFFKIIGILWVVSPILFCEISRPGEKEKYKLNDEDEEFLYSSASSMWHFFEKYVSEETNYLPPDNVQYAPYRVAMRTSPTNIGLYLLCALAARDFGFIDSKELATKVMATLKTVDKLPKWHCNLYNWYDISTLEPLSPQYVSSVDCGNFLCSITALKEGMKEFLWEAPELNEAIVLCERIIEESDISLLYNKRRKLFYIGYDVVLDSYGDNLYDILMSEARMTSYYAIARKIADKKHWGTLGRLYTGADGYIGPVSWTGTMFEYYMPHLLLPVVDDSLSDEALKYALYCQKKKGASYGLPWGISESGFYSFDGTQNYQYKAFGVQKLGLKRGLDEEIVISPYATYLTLPFAPNDAINNLKKLVNLGLNGEFGLYEAIDFTPSRVGRGFGMVKSYMAHHLGMSLISVSNMMFDGIMQKRFMKDPDMRSAQKVLEEAIYDDVPIYKGISAPEEKRKNKKFHGADSSYTSFDPWNPRAILLSNGEYSSTITDGGCGFSYFDGIDINAHERDTALSPVGVFAFLKEEGGEAFSLTAAPHYDSVMRRADFSSSSVVFSAVKEGLEAVMGVCVHGRLPAEIRSFKVGNTDKKKKECSFILYTEPVLRKKDAHKAHKAFSDIFLTCNYLKDENCVLFSRKGSSEETLYAAYGFSDLDLHFEFETDRSKIMSKAQGVLSLKDAFEREFSNRDGTPVIPCLGLRLKFSLKGNENKGFTFIQCVGRSKEECLSRLLNARKQSFQSAVKSSLENAGGVATLYSLNEQSLSRLSKVTSRVFFNCRRAKTKDINDLSKIGYKDALWSMSISGDNPIVTYSMVDKSSLGTAIDHIKLKSFLKLKGCVYDLCILYNEGGAYNSEITTELRRVAEEKGVTESVFLIDMTRTEKEKSSIIKEVSVLFDGELEERFEDKRPFSLSATLPVVDTENVEAFVPGGGFEKEAFITYPQKSQSTLPWGFPLANKTFGSFLSDASLGFTFYRNSRLNQGTRWSNDYMRDNFGEKLYLRCNDEIYDLTSSAFVRFSDGLVEYRVKAGVISAIVRVSVHRKFQSKIVKVFLENTGFGKVRVQLAYYVSPFANRVPFGAFSCKRDGNILVAKDNMNVEYGESYVAVSGDGKNLLMTDEEAFFTGDWRDDSEEISNRCCLAVISEMEVLSGEGRKSEFYLSMGSEGSVLYPHRIFKNKPGETDDLARFSSPAFVITTPQPEIDRLVNFYLPYQTEISRIYSRTGFSQNSGAFGFRDQLQDACSLVYSNPRILRNHILKCASVQFEQGDVLHWWHKLPQKNGGFKGVRTRCSDDFLWLPYAVAFYVEKTGDISLVDMKVNYITGEKLPYGEQERYITPVPSGNGSVYEHCKRALEFSWKRGVNGLLLVGSGDWNDGMNRVGIKGKGESVWLSMFAVCVMELFSKLSRKLDDETFAEVMDKRCDELRKAIESNAWEDDRYIRGYHDDGNRLGSVTSEEAKIDSLPQSFSVFSSCKAERSDIALDSAIKHLVMREKNIVRLFDPPYDKVKSDIGYIKSYPRGVRENGGQYTHAAVWLAKALFKKGRADEGMDILNMISPITHSFDSEYKLEPYFIAADIYTADSCIGRGGWSIYTGAAAWYYRVVIEDLLGIQKIGNRVYFKPSVPRSWEEFTLEAELDGTRLLVVANKTGNSNLTINGEKGFDYVTLDGRNKKVILEF